MNFIFLMDPLETVVMDKDTSFILMLGAHRRGHRVFFTTDGGLTLLDGNVVFDALEVTPQPVAGQPFLPHQLTRLSGEDIHAVFIRTDPPFNYRYLMHTWLLEHLPPSVPVINNPRGVRTVNEKIWAVRFTKIVPPTMIGRQYENLLAFLQLHDEIVIKPTDGHGGRAVFRLRQGDPNTNVILETSTENFTRDVVAQRFIPQAADGDKRVLLCNGEPLGAILRIHSGDDHRNNLFAGGQARPAGLTDRDREIIATLRPHLKNLGLHFVGIDILGDYLIEVNVTSPTCLQEMNRFYGQALENKVIEFVEGLCHLQPGGVSGREAP